ncbi:MAG: ankyrin repeat domain-containing protein [Luteolibacter sp.]
MKWISKSAAGTVLLTVCLLGVPSCKKRPRQAMASDLQQAGYQLTAADWFRACLSNDVEALKKFISGGFSDKTKDDQGNVGLHHAAKGGAEKAAEFLLNRRLPIDERNADQRTPLMVAVMEKQPAMTSYLLRQGADPKAKDKDGYTPLMLAVKAGSANCVSELAPYDREELDAALLLAAMDGRNDVIDALTNYGASVYARMEDGRTPLMIAAENGHLEAVKLLRDLGSSRFTTDAEGKMAADLAREAGYEQVAEFLVSDPASSELSLESDSQVADQMQAYVNAAAAEGADGAVSQAKVETTVSQEIRPLGGETLSTPVVRRISPETAKSEAKTASFTVPPLVMRTYREKEIPVEVQTVEGGAAVMRISGGKGREVRLREGEKIPGSNLVVVKMKRRMESSKLNFGQPTEVSVVEVKDSATGTTRDWIAGVPTRAHDPVALVEDAATGKRYIASPGQRFKAADGREFVVSDVRPNQLIIEDAATQEVQTIPLSGPRG